MRYQGQQVLVTGPDGFLGTPLCEGLVREGARVRAFIQYGSASPWLDRSPASAAIERVPGDIRDVDTVRRAARGVDTIFHLAALTTVPWSLEAPGSYVQTNINGTFHILQAAQEAGARLILASSSQVYGQAQVVPIPETHPLQTRTPYAATKLAQEKLVEAWQYSFGLKAVVLRTFFTYGPRQSLRNIVPTVITQLLAGPSLQLGNLHPARDFVFVDDMVEGYLRAGCLDSALGQTLNLSGDRPISIGALVERVGAILGVEPQVVQDPRRTRSAGAELDVVAGDSARALDLLGWRPQTDLDAGLRQTIAWYRAHGALLAAAST